MLLEKLRSAFDRQDDTGAFDTKESLIERRKAARKLIEQGTSTAPISNGWEGLARIMGGVNGAIQNYQAGKSEKAAYDNARQQEQSLFGGGTSQPVAPVATTPDQSMSINPMVQPASSPQGGAGIGAGGIRSPGMTGAISGIDDRYTPDEARKQLALWNQNARPDTLSGLTDQAAIRKAAFLEDNPYEATGYIQSGYRSPETQKKLFDDAVLKYGSEEAARKWVAPPGKSQHGYGNATDIHFDDPRGGEWARANADKYGLAFPMKHEPWHVEPAGARDNAPMAQRGFTSYAGVPKTDQSGQPVQMAQAQAQPSPQTGPSNAQLMGIVNNEFSSEGSKTVARAMLQKRISAEQKDPLDTAVKQTQLEGMRLSNQKAMRELNEQGFTDKDRPDGSIVRIFKDGTSKQMAGPVSRETAPTTRTIKQSDGSEVAVQWDAANSKWVPLQAPDGGNAVQGSKAEREVEDRRAAAGRAGLKPDSPGYQSFLLTGRMPREDQQPLSATDKKAVMEADESVVTTRGTIDMLKQAKELSSQAYNGGPFAAQRGYAGSLFGDAAGSATVQMDNTLTTQALSSMKSIFGGNPTEGERKILLDIQGASRLPHADRVKIIDRAISMAERRLAMNERVSSQMRDGTYFKKPGDVVPTMQTQPAQSPAQGQVRKFNPVTGAIE